MHRGESNQLDNSAGGTVSIEVDFQKSMEAARVLAELAVLLERITDCDIGSTIRRMAVCWEGEEAEVLCRKGEQFYRRLKHSASALSGAARITEQTARQIYMAEQQAAMLAKLRRN